MNIKPGPDITHPMNLIKQISALILILSSLAAALGCASKAPMGNDRPWNEAVHEDVKEWTACSGGAAQPGQENDEQADAAFFMQSKPRLSTVQIWLDSGKTVTDRIRAYLDACFDDSSTAQKTSPPASPLVGRWYGLDRVHDSAVVFVFRPSADFSWETRGRQITGTYALGPDKEGRKRFINPIY